MKARKIIHLDMDCFYAAVEVKYRPEFKGKPLGIGGPANSRGVLCTASYEARKFKVRSAMPSSMAMRLCPQLILLPPNFELYKKESRAIRKIFERFTDKVEPLSLDEAYLDVTDSGHFGGSATKMALEIRRLIQTELNLTASAGVASNKFLAKIASDWNKPNGQFVIRPDEIEAFMPALKIEKLFGVGKVTAQKMHDLGLFTCADLQKQSVPQLTRWFGSRGADLSDLSRGIDHREVDTSQERKSLTVEETFNRDLASYDEWRKQIPELYQDWERRMQKAGGADRIRSIVIKVKFFDFKNTTHETSVRSWPSAQDFENLLKHVWERRPEPARLIGLGVHFLSEEVKEKDTSQLSFAI